MSFYRTKKFKSLQGEWDKILRDSGFKDIEDKKGNLKDHDRRTISFDNRDAIRDFYVNLGSMVSSTNTLSDLEKNVLTLYCDGMYVIRIARRVKKSRQWVHKIIAKYKKILHS